ncbi:hypothetical protein K3495_g14399 [Podosphaera aphanis]|nr:hypothetical protein K3495_g14399 [Podosphaera aphanis]
MLIQPKVQEEQAARPQWKKADREVVNRSLAAKLRLLERERLSLNSRETIDQRVISITEIIQLTTKETIPRARLSSFAKTYWTSEYSKAVKDTRKARRKWKTLGTKDSWLGYLTSTSIKKAKNIGWRATVSEAAQDPTKSGNSPRAADTGDIDGSTYLEDLSNISDVITQTEIKEILQKLPSDKAPGPDGIPNRFLKCCEPLLSKFLAELFNVCLTLGYHPKMFKESTTIVLRKPQKLRYDTPKSYRLIALLKTKGKLLENLVANRISKAAEEFNLFPEEQIGA